MVIIIAFQVVALLLWWALLEHTVTLQVHTAFGLTEARRKAENLPRVYQYYCPSCLYQTNEKHDGCPKCGGSGLRFTESRRRSMTKVQGS